MLTIEADNMPTTDRNTFKATQYDAEIALEAVRLIAAAMAPMEADSGEVGNALDAAVKAFPGFQEFTNELADEDLGDPILDTSALEAAHAGPTLAAIRDAAVVGAIAELCEGFEWDDAERCGRACAKAVAALDQAGSPALR